MTTLLQTAQPKTVTPAGFISYCYDDPNVGVQHVPYESVDDMRRALADSLRSGFPVDGIACYVWNKEDANLLFGDMAFLGPLPNVTGRVAPVYGLTDATVANLMR